jgi:hypothetical protein
MSGSNPQPPEGGSAEAPAAARRSGWRHLAVAVGLSVVVLLAVPIAVLFALPDHDRAAAKPGRAEESRPARIARARTGRGRAEVSIVSPLRTTSVPPSFLGLSTEYWALPIYERRFSLLERVLSLLHVRGNGPFVLRIGGDSADQTFWEPRSRTPAPWVYGLTPPRLRQITTLVRRAHLHVILDLNLITGSPRAAAELASAAEDAFPRRSIIGFEVGNEPDIYSRRDWLAGLSETPLRAGFLRKELSTATYIHEFESYSRALEDVAPSVPLAGPALANPVRNADWVSRLLASPHPGLGTVTAHRYLYSACLPHRSPGYPTVARLLSERSTTGMARALEPLVGDAHQAGLKFRLTELNSVTCRGVPGVSDTFATALWAPDALFELLRASIDGVNVHVRTNAINGAFTLSGQGLGARPLLYGLILFAKALSPDPRLVQLRLTERSSVRLKAWATRVSGDVLHVVLINKGSQPVTVGLRLPTTRPAGVERLLAPSPRSISGVTLGGQQLGRDGLWYGPRMIQSITPGASGYQLLVPRASAALVSVSLPRARRGRLARRRHRHATATRG